MDNAPSTAALAPSAANIKRTSAVGKESATGQPPAVIPASTVKDVVSPGELCGFVDSLLNNLEERFDEMSEQIMQRMDDMCNRIDNLENSIQDLMHEGIDSPTLK